MKNRTMLLSGLLALSILSGCSTNDLAAIADGQKQIQTQSLEQKSTPKNQEQPKQSPPQTGQKQQSTNETIVKGRWATVTGVSDGDTITVDNSEKIRLIGVNSPESVKQGVKPMPFSVECSAYTKSQLLGKKVFIELDIQQSDQYSRTLAYLYLQEPKSKEDIRKYMYNAILLREGYAQLLTIPPNVKYTNEIFVPEQRAAREAGLGMWSLGIYRDVAKSSSDVFIPGKEPEGFKKK